MSEFSKCVKNYKLDQEIVDSWKLAIESFKIPPATTPRTECWFKNDNLGFGIWNIGLGDKSKQKRKRGGYRLICVFFNNLNKVRLYNFYYRDELNKTKGQKEYQKNLRLIKKEITDEFQS